MRGRNGAVYEHFQISRRLSPGRAVARKCRRERRHGRRERPRHESETLEGLAYMLHCAHDAAVVHAHGAEHCYYGG